jgi:hypothetical protein
MAHLNRPSRRDPMPDRQPVDYILGLDPYFAADRIRRRDQVARMAARFLLTAILLLSAAAFAWVLGRAPTSPRAGEDSKARLEKPLAALGEGVRHG